MALNLEDKKTLVAEVAEVAAKAQSVVAAEYRGLTVGQMTELRAKARTQGVYMRVVKNTLARKALAGTSFESVGPKLKGPLVLAFSKDDPGAAARVVKDFAKANDKLVATLVSIGGQVLPGADLDRVASLPTRAQAQEELPPPGAEREVDEHRAEREQQPFHVGVKDLRNDAAQVDLVEEEREQRRSDNQNDGRSSVRSHVAWNALYYTALAARSLASRYMLLL